MGLGIWERLWNRAAHRPKRVVFPEGTDERVLEAAGALVQRQVVHPWLVGAEPAIHTQASRLGIRLTGVHIVDPTRSADREATSDPLLFGSWLLKTGQVDGFVGGAIRTSADTIRTTLKVIGVAPGVSTLCGLFILTPPETGPQAHHQALLLADCAVIPEPSSRQLAHIAVNAVEAYRMYLTGKPHVAFLSFSTRGSARHALVERVRQATAMAKELLPRVSIDGELQVDAAMDRTVAARKGAGDSPVAGEANVLIFPTLEAGNIGYKLLQWLGGWRAVGPLLWGLNKPASDLSRGCSSEDIGDAAVLTAILAQEREGPLSGASPEPRACPERSRRAKSRGRRN
ncbi:MAG: phosphate acetyltransferase [Elusimicrobia bacterium]|nr:phosphate acetyltransferase [Elusimicrobiota bacterium]